MSQLSKTERERMQAEVQTRYGQAAWLSRTRDQTGSRPTPPTEEEVGRAEQHERIADALACILRDGPCLGGHVHDVYIHPDDAGAGG